uniref:Uncharacterized protein n=1 Tax=Cannabis sativa TaxID=3483 RepID=A0A803R8U5_CANSA
MLGNIGRWIDAPKQYFSRVSEHKGVLGPLFHLVGSLPHLDSHISMILSALCLSPHGFIFGNLPKRPHTNGVVYILIYP